MLPRHNDSQLQIQFKTIRSRRMLPFEKLLWNAIELNDLDTVKEQTLLLAKRIAKSETDDHSYSFAAVDEQGRGFLCYAFRLNQLEIAEYLFNFFYEKLKNNELDTSPFWIVPEDGRSALWWACAYGHRTLVQKLLDLAPHSELFPTDDELPNEISALSLPDKSHGANPLSIATQHDHLDVVQMLLATIYTLPKASDIINRADKYGDSPLHHACRQNNTEIAKALLQFNCLTNTINNEGTTPLHEACQHHNDIIASILLRQAGDMNYSNNNNETPFHLISENRRASFIIKLSQQGALIGKTLPEEILLLSNPDEKLFCLGSTFFSKKNSRIVPDHHSIILNATDGKKYIQHLYALLAIQQKLAKPDSADQVTQATELIQQIDNILNTAKSTLTQTKNPSQKKIIQDFYYPIIAAYKGLKEIIKEKFNSDESFLENVPPQFTINQGRQFLLHIKHKTNSEGEPSVILESNTVLETIPLYLQKMLKNLRGAVSTSQDQLIETLIEKLPTENNNIALSLALNQDREQLAKLINQLHHLQENISRYEQATCLSHIILTAPLTTFAIVILLTVGLVSNLILNQGNKGFLPDEAVISLFLLVVAGLLGGAICWLLNSDRTRSTDMARLSHQRVNDLSVSHLSSHDFALYQECLLELRDVVTSFHKIVQPDTQNLNNMIETDVGNLERPHVIIRTVAEIIASLLNELNSLIKIQINQKAQPLHLRFFAPPQEERVIEISDEIELARLDHMN